MGLMHDDLAAKRKRLLKTDESENIASPLQSRFFGKHSTSRLGPTPNEVEVLNTQEVVLVADCGDAEEVEDSDADASDEEPDQVAQEDGYLSPTPSLRRLSTPDLSSPPQFAEVSRVFCRDSSTGDFAVDVLSSPETRKPPLPLRNKSLSSRATGRTLVPDTPRKSGPVAGGRGAEVLSRPDLLFDADTTEIAEFSVPPCSFGGSTQSQSSSGLDTPVSQEAASVVVACDEDVDVGDDIEFIEIRRATQDAVARGWWTKWARGGASEQDATKDHSRHRVCLLSIIFLFLC